MTRAGARAGAWLACALACALAGCGKKAPLRLPEQRPPAQVGTFRARIRDRNVSLEFHIPKRRLFPEQETPWSFTRILRRDGPGGDFVEVGTLVDADGFEFGTKVQWTDAGREPGIAYTYKVELLKQDARTRAVSPPLEVLWKEEPPPPAALAAAGAEGSILLTWEPPAAGRGAGFIVARRPEGNPREEPLTRTPVAEGRYLDAAVAVNRTYCYRVRSVTSTPAVDVEGSPSAEVCATTTDRTPPPVPAGVVLIPEERSILISWGPVAADDLLGYVVYRAADAGPFERITPAPVEETTYRDAAEELRQGVVYRYRVSALDRATQPNESAFSETVAGSLTAP